jgi:DNA modification methylase
VATTAEDNPTALRRTFGYTPNTEKAAESNARGVLRDRSDPTKKALPNPSDNLGRWPANLIHDGSEEVLAGFPETGAGSAARFFYCAKASRSEREAGLREAGLREAFSATMGGGIGEREHDPTEPRAYVRNHHPTVKPIALAEYLARLILPPKRDTPRRLLVPFSGSGSEMIGALLAGWDEVVGIELSPEYAEIAEARLAHWTAGQQELAL